MIKWMKSLLRKLQGRGPEQRTVLAKDGTSRHPIAAVGLHLAYFDANGNRRLMGVSEAADADQYWSAWESVSFGHEVYVVDPLTGERERYRPD